MCQRKSTLQIWSARAAQKTCLLTLSLSPRRPVSGWSTRAGRPCSADCTYATYPPVPVQSAGQSHSYLCPTSLKSVSSDRTLDAILSRILIENGLWWLLTQLYLYKNHLIQHYFGVDAMSNVKKVICPSEWPCCTKNSVEDILRHVVLRGETCASLRFLTRVNLYIIF